MEINITQSGALTEAGVTANKVTPGQTLEDCQQNDAGLLSLLESRADFTKRLKLSHLLLCVRFKPKKQKCLCEIGPRS